MHAISLPGRWCLAAAVATAFGILAPLSLVVAASLVAGWLVTRRFGYQAAFVLCLLIVLGSMSGRASDARLKGKLDGSIPEVASRSVSS
jgi:hypothetical protein